MEAVRINSPEALRDYLSSAYFANPLSSSELDQVVNSAVFDNNGFRGLYAKPLMEKLSENERNAFCSALGLNFFEGRPAVIFDHYPGANGRCAPRDNYWCAQY